MRITTNNSNLFVADILTTVQKMALLGKSGTLKITIYILYIDLSLEELNFQSEIDTKKMHF